MPQAGELLRASYQVYRHTGTNDTILRTIGYALPAVLHQHVRTVVPTTYFASKGTLSPTSRRRPIAVTEDWEVRNLKSPLITPSELRSLYKTAAYEPNARGRNKLGLLGHQDEYPSEEDLNLFMSNLRSDGVHADYTVVKINGGGYDPRHPGIEGNLDMQYAQAMAYPTPHVFYSVGGQIAGIPESNKPAEDDQWFAWLEYLIEEPEVPQTISVSYGNFERDIPPEYATALCEMFAQLGARGVSVLVASGDDGVGEGTCETYDGSGRVRFIPEFPSSCMCSIFYMSLFGAVYPSRSLHIAATVSQVPMSLAWAARWETPRLRRASLGAASQTISLARRIRTRRCPSSWIASAVGMKTCTSAVLFFFSDLFLLGNFLWFMYCSSTSRGIPDIAAQSVRFLIVMDHETATVSGTSAAAPVHLPLLPLLCLFYPSSIQLTTNGTDRGGHNLAA